MLANPAQTSQPFLRQPQAQRSLQQGDVHWTLGAEPASRAHPNHRQQHRSRPPQGQGEAVSTDSHEQGFRVAFRKPGFLRGVPLGNPAFP